MKSYMPSNNTKTELEAYLKSVDLDSLEMLAQERRSSKRLDGGPMVFGRQSPYGKTKIASAMPKQVKDTEFGISSYHKGTVSDIKNILSSEGVRDQMIDKISKYLTSEVMLEQKLERRRMTDRKD